MPRGRVIQRATPTRAMARENGGVDDRGGASKGRQGPAGSSADSSRGVLSRLTMLQPTLRAPGLRLSGYILDHAADVMHMSITEVADAASVSEAYVVKLAHDLGLKGFQDLKIALARELVEPVKFIHEDVQPGDDAATVIRKVFQSDLQALTDTLHVLDAQAMQRAVELILSAERVEFYGIGSAGPVAVDLYYRMLRIGLPCAVLIDSHMQAVSAALTGPTVAVVVISHSGSTRETVDAMRIAKEAGARTICVTNFGKSPIQAYTDVALYTAAAETTFRTEAMTSRIAELSVVDTLYVCCALANFDRSVDNIARTADALSVKRL